MDVQKLADFCTSMVQFSYICREKQCKGYGKTIGKLRQIVETGKYGLHPV